MNISDMKEALEFEGWVEHKGEKGDYDQKINVANYKNGDEKTAMQNTKGKFPLCYEFKASVKNGTAAMLDEIDEGDKVKIRFYLVGRSGISKSRGTYYCINDLAIAKKNGIEVVERKPRVEDNAEQSEEDTVADDCPF